MINKEYKIAASILDKLGIPYVPSVGIKTELLIDECYGSISELSLLKKSLSADYWKHLCEILLQCNFFRTASATPMFIGKVSQGYLPIVLDSPFCNKAVKSIYKWHGLPASPCNMILTVPCEEYIEAAEVFYNKLRDTYESIMQILIQGGCPDAMTVVIENYHDLKMIIEKSKCGDAYARRSPHVERH